MAALVRLPFVSSIGPDEGGYAYVAWQWARGQTLYRSDWIDRPQGLILVYRLLIAIALSPWAIRLGAVAAGVAVSLLMVAAGRVESRRAGLLAGVLFATVGVAPHIEGFTFNGELAAAVPATAAVALALTSPRRRLLLAPAALLGATAMTMKQSGFDGLAVVLVVAIGEARGGRDRAARLGLVTAAAALPIAASVVGGAVDGWSSYWSAVAGSHFAAAGTSLRAGHFIATLPAVARDLLPLTAVAVLGLGPARERGTARYAAVWLAAALVGVNLGGSYWTHYYVQLLPPLCLLAGIGLARVRPRLAPALAALVALPALVFVGGVARAPDAQQETMIKYALGFENDQRIARYVDAHSAPGSSVYALVSRADFYFLAKRRAASPYLWGHPLREIPGALRSLERTLAAPRRPRIVVLFQRAPLRKHPLLATIIARDYRPVWRSPQAGTTVLAADRS